MMCASMATEDERFAEARRLQRIDDAFAAGDLGALRAAVDDPAAIPNGPMPITVGSCLAYAVYHSPIAFIGTLLDAGADPNLPVDDGFPPLIAALSTRQAAPGSTRGRDVHAILRLLLSRGADPNQRGINDYTPLHMAVAVRDGGAVQILLDGGADPDLRTRIDDYGTALEMAQAAGLTEIAAPLSRRGAPMRRRLRSGLTLLSEITGAGSLVGRQQSYHVRLRMWLSGGEPVRWPAPWGPVGVARLEDDGATLVTEIFVNRGQLISGLFYGLDGMRVGGTRRLEIAPQLAYRESGVPGVVPPKAVLTAEVTVLGAARAT
jgi:uncharacterized protein